MAKARRSYRTAVTTDVHANLPALEAALAAIKALDCDAIVHTGDAVGIGPFPRETLDRLLDEGNIRLVMGNHDWWYAQGLPAERPAWMSAGEATHFGWVHEQIGTELRTTVSSWPWVINDDYNGLHVAFTHYGLRVSGESFVDIVRHPTSDDLDKIFRRVPADLVFYGHHHPAADHQGRARYVNPGSLGCCHEPLARFAVLDAGQDGSFTITKHGVPYDWTDYFRQLEQREVPERRFIRTAFFGQADG